ncbi:MAG: hypothetical protein COB25_014180 [Oceanospirillales bacterium]|nr:hypothetical protein [Oceanospirillales bacterium]
MSAKFIQVHVTELAVDDEVQIIVANCLDNHLNRNHNGCLVPLLEEVKDALERYNESGYSIPKIHLCGCR